MNTLEDYFTFVKEHPTLFYNPPVGGFTILLDEKEIHEAEATVAHILRARGMPEEWATVGIVFEDRHGSILRDAVRFPGGMLGTYIRFVSRSPGTTGIAVLPVYQGRVLVLRRFRHATRSWHLEIPLGIATGSASDSTGMMLEAQVREVLMSEIAAISSRIVALGPVDDGPGLAADTGELFYAELETYGQLNTAAGISEVLNLSLPEFEALIRDHQITDSFTIAAYIRAKLRNLFSGDRGTDESE